jgi:hypothetical protein
MLVPELLATLTTYQRLSFTSEGVEASQIFFDQPLLPLQLLVLHSQRPLPHPQLLFWSACVAPPYIETIKHICGGKRALKYETPVNHLFSSHKKMEIKTRVAAGTVRLVAMSKCVYELVHSQILLTIFFLP